MACNLVKIELSHRYFLKFSTKCAEKLLCKLLFTGNLFCRKVPITTSNTTFTTKTDLGSLGAVNYLHKELYLRCCMGPRFPSTYDVPSVVDVFRMQSIKAVCSLGLIVRLTIRHQLFLEFWLVNGWFFAHPHDQDAVTRLENVHQLNIRRDKKLGFQLSHRQPRDVSTHSQLI